MVKSPFVLYKDFLSPKICEEVVSQLNLSVPNYDQYGAPEMTMISSDLCEQAIFKLLVRQQIIEYIEQYYGFEYHGTEKMVFEWYPAGFSNHKMVCENSNFIKGKWQRSFDRDFTGVLFLNDYRGAVPLDVEYEAYGGKLDFPFHGFAFNPKRGTLVIYPSGPNFLNVVTPVHVGDAIMARFHVAAKVPYVYDKSKFSGDFEKWF